MFLKILDLFIHLFMLKFVVRYLYEDYTNIKTLPIAVSLLSLFNLGYKCFSSNIS